MRARAARRPMRRAMPGDWRQCACCYIVSGFGGLWALLRPAIGRNPAPRFAEIGAQHEGPSVGCGREQAPLLHQDARLDAGKYLVSTEFQNGPTGGNHFTPLSHIILSYLLPLSAPATRSSHLLLPTLGGCISILGLAPSFSPSLSMLKKKSEINKKINEKINDTNQQQK